MVLAITLSLIALIWPDRVRAGAVGDEMAMNTDILPTVLDLLKISQPTDRIIDGTSIAPTLRIPEVGDLFQMEVG